MEKHFVIVNRPAGTGHVVTVDDNDPDWTYQDLAGPCGTIWRQANSKEEADAELAKFLNDDDRASQGTYCTVCNVKIGLAGSEIFETDGGPHCWNCLHPEDKAYYA